MVTPRMGRPTHGTFGAGSSSNLSSQGDAMLHRVSCFRRAFRVAVLVAVLPCAYFAYVVVASTATGGQGGVASFAPSIALNQLNIAGVRYAECQKDADRWRAAAAQLRQEYTACKTNDTARLAAQVRALEGRVTLSAELQRELKAKLDSYRVTNSAQESQLRALQERCEQAAVVTNTTTLNRLAALIKAPQATKASGETDTSVATVMTKDAVIDALLAQIQRLQQTLQQHQQHQQKQQPKVPPSPPTTTTNTTTTKSNVTASTAVKPSSLITRAATAAGGQLTHNATNGTLLASPTTIITLIRKTMLLMPPPVRNTNLNFSRVGRGALQAIRNHTTVQQQPLATNSNPGISPYYSHLLRHQQTPATAAAAATMGSIRGEVPLQPQPPSSFPQVVDTYAAGGLQGSMPP